MAKDYHTIETLPGANASFLTDLQNFLNEEWAERFNEILSPFVLSGGTHGTAAGLTGTPASLVAYPGGFRVAETGSITYIDSETSWVIVNKDLTGDLGNFVRVAGTHYLVNIIDATEPTIPANSLFLMRVTTAAGAISAVEDKRQLSSGPGIAGVSPGAAYGTLEAAVSAIGSTVTTLLITSPLPVNTNVTVPTTLTLRFEGNGSLNVVTGVVVTINGPLQAPLKKIFNCVGSEACIVFGVGSVTSVFVDWWGPLKDRTDSTTTSAAFQAAIDSLDGTGLKSGEVVISFGRYLITDVQIPTSLRGLTIRGQGRHDLNQDGTGLFNSGTGAMFTTKGVSTTLSWLTIKNLSMYGDSASAGDMIAPKDTLTTITNLKLKNIYCSLANTASSFLNISGGVIGSLKLTELQIVGAPGFTVSPIKVITKAGQNIFGAIFDDLTLVSNTTATAPFIFMDNRGEGISSDSHSFRSIVFETPRGGAIELRSLRRVSYIRMLVADLTTAPTQALFLIGKSTAAGSLSADDHTFIASTIIGGDATNGDIEAENAASAEIIIIGCRLGYFNATNQSTTIINSVVANITGSGHVPFWIRAGSIRGINGLSSTATEALNFKGSATLASGTKAVDFTDIGSSDEPDAVYAVLISSEVNETFWVTSKATTGFTINSSNGSSTATVDWILIR